MIISFVQTKGETGKSTLAMNTAFSRCMGRNLVEPDPQGTLNTWWNEREDAHRHSGKVSFHHISYSGGKHGENASPVCLCIF